MRLLLIGLVSALISFTVVGSATAEEIKDRFLREGPAAWARIRESEQQVVGILHMKHTTIQKNAKEVDPAFHKINKFKVNGNLISLTTLMPDGLGENVVVSGPKYGFKIVRPSDQKAYTLNSIVFAEFEANAKTIRSASFLWNSLTIPRVCWNAPLEDVIATPGFVIKRIAEIDDENQRVVRVDFDCKSEKYKLDAKDAWMTFKPSENWAIQKAEFNLRPDWKVSMTNQYRIGKDGINRLARCQSKYQFSIHQIEENYEYIFDEIEGRVVPESEFKLEFFNLPEPTQPSLSSYQGKVHYWLIGIAIVFFSAAFLLRRASN